MRENAWSWLRAWCAGCGCLVQGYENMVKLNELNEPTILHNLRHRYKRNDIYTYVGTILIAVNPFKLLPLYTPQIQDLYKEKVRRVQRVQRVCHVRGLCY
jgi:myosin heavy subunit